MAAPTYVQTIGTKINSGSVAASTIPIVLTANTTIGNTVVIVVKGSAGFVASSVSDSRGNTYAVDKTNAQSGNSISILRANLSTALLSGDTITITMGGSSLSMSAVAYEYNGILVVSPLDASNATGANTVSTITAPAITTTDPNDVLIAGLALNTNAVSITSRPASFTSRGGLSGAGVIIDMVDRAPGATGSYSAAWNWNANANAAAAIVAYFLASINIAQLAANVTATGGVQTVATVNDVSLAQIAANVTSTGGTQAVNTSNFVAITQVAGVVTASGGTQSLAAIVNAAITQQAANVTATGGAQDVTSSTVNAAVTQLAASVTATGGTQIISTSTGPLPPNRQSANVIFLLDGRIATRLANNVYLPL